MKAAAAEPEDVHIDVKMNSHKHKSSHSLSPLLFNAKLPMLISMLFPLAVRGRFLTFFPEYPKVSTLKSREGLNKLACDRICH